jgi:hypothetical protein
MHCAPTKTTLIGLKESLFAKRKRRIAFPYKQQNVLIYPDTTCCVPTKGPPAANKGFNIILLYKPAKSIEVSWAKMREY